MCRRPAHRQLCPPGVLPLETRSQDYRDATPAATADILNSLLKDLVIQDFKVPEKKAPATSLELCCQPYPQGLDKNPIDSPAEKISSFFFTPIILLRIFIAFAHPEAATHDGSCKRFRQPYLMSRSPRQQVVYQLSTSITQTEFASTIMYTLIKISKQSTGWVVFLLCWVLAVNVVIPNDRRRRVRYLRNKLSKYLSVVKYNKSIMDEQNILLPAFACNSAKLTIAKVSNNIFKCLANQFSMQQVSG